MNDSTLTRNPNMTRTNSASTSILAKLLAREDLTVVFSPSSDTAYFNGATRMLTLPVWENMSDELTEMLVAHEVGHALHTPAGEDPIVSAIRSIDPNMSAEAKSYINIAEDARIEQEIKSEFPGSRKTFAMGYRDLLNRDMFDLDSIPMEERTLCDRINIHAKIGFSVDVPFDDYEREILDAVMGAKTWEEVVEGAKAMWEYDGTIGRKKIENAQGQNSKISAPGSAGDAEGETENDSESDSEESGDGESQESNSDTDGQKNSDSSENTQKAAKKSDSNPDSSNDEKDENEVHTKMQAESVPEFAAPAAPASAKAIEKGLDSLRNRSQRERIYGVMPVPNLSETDGLIVPFKTVARDMDSWATQNRQSSTASAAMIDNAYALFRRENDKQVNLMAREFERRRAAMTHRRTRTGNRGVINVNRLHTYKFSEDIFKTYNIAKDGKSHGMVMFVDWSSSMSPVIGDTINQTLSLASFCRKVGIPFEVYAFSSHNPCRFRETVQPGGSLTRGDLAAVRAAEAENLWSKNPGDLNAYGFSLLNLLSNRMTKIEFETMAKNLIAFTDFLGENEFVRKVLPANMSRSNYYRWMATSVSGNYGLGGTPLNSAILAAHDLLNKFRSETKTQVLTAIFLTDGEGTDHVLSRRYGNNGDVDNTPTGNSPNSGTWGCPVYVRHRSTREFFEVEIHQTDKCLLNSLRRVTGARIIGFNILHTPWNRMVRTRHGATAIDWSIRKYFEPADALATPFDPASVIPIIEKAATEGVLPISHSETNGYDELYILSGKSMSLSEGDEMDRLEDSATITKIRNAFLKQNSTGRKSRVFLNRFIPMIAESL